MMGPFITMMESQLAKAPEEAKSQIKAEIAKVKEAKMEMEFTDDGKMIATRSGGPEDGEWYSPEKVDSESVLYLGVILAYMMRTSQSGDAPQSWLAHQKDLQFARRAWPGSLLARRRTHTNLQQQDGKSTRQNCLTNWLCGHWFALKRQPTVAKLTTELTDAGRTDPKPSGGYLG